MHSPRSKRDWTRNARKPAPRQPAYLTLGGLEVTAECFTDQLRGPPVAGGLTSVRVLAHGYLHLLVVYLSDGRVDQLVMASADCASPRPRWITACRDWGRRVSTRTEGGAISAITSSTEKVWWICHPRQANNSSARTRRADSAERRDPDAGRYWAVQRRDRGTPSCRSVHRQTHVSMMMKLGARDRAQLVVCAHESGVVRPPGQPEPI